MIQQLITEIENKILETKQIIANYETSLTNHKNLLTQLIKQLNEIKKNMKLSNQNNADHSEINTK